MKAPQRSTRSYAHEHRPWELYRSGFEQLWQRCHFLPQQREFAASTIAAIYQDRWQIELFCKARQQSLRGKTLVGTSAQAFQTPIGTALMARWLLQYLPRKAR